MASRYDIRSVIIQTLFEADFRNVLDKDHSLKILSRNVLEFLDLTENPEFAESILLGVILKREVLDEIIQKAAPEWPLYKISIIDRALLRLGLFELIFGETYNIPHKVAINEAIELAKAFGGDSSRKFVNGVLGGIYKEMNVSEKDISSKKTEVIDLSGALVYNSSDQELKIALVYDIFKYWTLPKGRILEGEEKSDCAIRKVKEELGINAEIESILDENQYISGSEKDIIVKKHVTYFLAKTEEINLSVQKDITGILEAKFFTQDEIKSLKIYKDIKPIIEKGLQIIKK